MADGRADEATSDIVERLLPLLDEAEASDWPALRQRVVEARQAWAAAVEGLGEEEAGAIRDGDWSGRDLCAHVASFLRLTADALGCLATAQELPSGLQELPTDLEFPLVLNRVERGWDDVAMAAVTAGKIPDPGAVLMSPLGSITMKQFLALTSMHMTTHAEQLRAMRTA